MERADPLLGTIFDRKFRLEFRLAMGGFGAIYRATHITSGHEFAIKVVHARLASDPGVVARFRREGATLTTLRSPHTVTAYEVGETPAGTLYLVMELLAGVNLFDRFRQTGPLPWRRMVAIARGVCESLSEAHALGIVHRDLKPTNIHLERKGDDDDFVKVLDFGIAKILEHSPFDNSDLTSAGLMIGTLDYMAPEQMVGGEITGATDLYTLGIVIYEMITGRRPFPEASTASSALAAALKSPPPLSSIAMVPAELDRVVMTCLERDARNRYESADQLAAALQRLLGPSDAAAARKPAGDDDATMITPQPERMTPTAFATPRPERMTPTAFATPRPERMTPTAFATPPPERMTPTAFAAPAPPPHRTPPPDVAAPRAQAPSPRARTPPPIPTASPPESERAVAPPPPALEHTLRGIAVPEPPRQPTRTTVDATILDRSDRRDFDMAGVATRDALVRRIVWVIVLVLAAVIGIVLATQL